MPALDVTVCAADGGALLDAEVTVVRFSYPYARVDDFATQATSDGGVASFAESRAWEVIWPLMPHGIPFYDFAWCAQAPAYTARLGMVPVNGSALRVTLEPGDAGCPPPQAVVDRARLQVP